MEKAKWSMLVNYNFHKFFRFLWRTLRNLICSTKFGRALLFPTKAVAKRFGPSDTEYAIKVFLHHYIQLTDAGFLSAKKILEIGPGQNLGTCLLMWAINTLRTTDKVEVVLWDVFSNLELDNNKLKEIANSIISSKSFPNLLDKLNSYNITPLLQQIFSLNRY